MATPEELAYAAGIIDGEGYVGIGEVRPNDRRRKSPTIKAQVAVVQADPVIPVWLAETFGGSFQSYPPRKPGQRGTTRWSLQGSAAAEFCGLILDWLKLKRPQAELVIGYYADPRFVFKQRQGIPDDEIEQRREYVTRSKVLSARGGGQ